jgi:leucyl aminopeptidase
MKLLHETAAQRRIKTDAIVLFVPEQKKKFPSVLAAQKKVFGRRLERTIELAGFEGKAGELVEFHTEGKYASPRLLIVGLGDSTTLSLERFRRAASTAAKKARSLKLKDISFSVAEITTAPENSCPALPDIIGALLEGSVLSLYKYDKYITVEKNKNKPLRSLSISGSPLQDQALKKILSEVRIICDGVYRARDLENAPGNDIYPETLAAAAQASAATHGFRVSVWDRKRIEAAGFGGLLAVSAGSNRPPRFIILEHQSGRKDLPTIVLVGKGVTFDAGGISIKPAGGMAEMKMDMSGAAAVIGTMEVVSRLKLPVHVVGLIPSTENLLGGSAMRPGDIITHYGGTTSEVDNTDAEGRLILADALAYASTFSPDVVIDLATLTGACVVALGHHATGMLGNDDPTMEQLKQAGERTYERVWQLPLFEEYEKQIRSDVADVKNVGGRWAGAITAALFLKKFVGENKWVHLDIAGTAILEEDLPYAAKGGSGVGVRLLAEFIRNWKPGTKPA